MVSTLPSKKSLTVSILLGFEQSKGTIVYNGAPVHFLRLDMTVAVLFASASMTVTGNPLLTR